MKDRINTKVTHRHMLVDLRGMAVEELQNLPQCFIIDLFGPWAHVYGNVFSIKVVKSIVETLLFWAVSISTRTCYQCQWRFAWSWNDCECLLNQYWDSQVIQLLPTKVYTTDKYWKIYHWNFVALNLLTSVPTFVCVHTCFHILPLFPPKAR